MSSLRLLSWVVLLSGSLFSAHANENCLDSLRKVLVSRVPNARTIAKLEDKIAELRALRNKGLDEYFVAKQSVKTPGGESFERKAMSPESLKKFTADFERLITLRETVEGLDYSFFSWWKQRKDAYIEGGLVHQYFGPRTVTLDQIQNEVYMSYILQMGKVRGSGWAHRLMMKLGPKKIIIALGVSLPMWALSELKDIVIIGTGVQVYNAYTAPVVNPIVNKAGQVGAEHWGEAAKEVNNWLSSRKEVMETRGELARVVDEMGRFNFRGMDPEKARELWESFEKERLFPLLIRNQRSLPNHLRDARAHFRDVILQTPIFLATSMSQFDSQRLQYKQIRDRLGEKAKNGPLTESEIEDLALADRMIKNAESSIAATLASWKITSFLYPESTRGTGPDAIKNLSSGFEEMSKNFGFQEIYIAQYRDILNEILKRMDLVYLQEDANAELLQKLSSTRSPDSKEKAKLLPVKKKAIKNEALKK